MTLHLYFIFFRHDCSSRDSNDCCLCKTRAATQGTSCQDTSSTGRATPFDSAKRQRNSKFSCTKRHPSDGAEFIAEKAHHNCLRCIHNCGRLLAARPVLFLPISVGVSRLAKWVARWPDHFGVLEYVP